jgi:hypothetical protein
LSSQRRFALIIASDSYSDKKLTQLKAPTIDAKRLSELLKNPLVSGGYEITTLENTEAHIIRREILRFFKTSEKDDLRILYFAGHGYKSPEDGHLYLATTDSNLELYEETTIPAQFINSQIQKSKSSRIVLILDCCYSGAFARGMIARAEDKVLNVKDEFRESGSVILTSGTSMQFSWEGDELKKGEQGTSESTSFYTNLLIKGIESAEADLDKDNSITCNELNEYIRQKMKEDGHPQKPEIYILKGDITIVKKQVIEKIKDLPSLPQIYWENLLDAIDRKYCIPFIGDSAIEYFNQIDDYAFLTSKEIAKELAEKYDYPFAGPYELPKVAQYLAIEQENDIFPRTYISDRLSKVKPPDFYSDVYSKSPHVILAQLDLPIYVTTNYDLLLEEAIKSQGKEPISEICTWNEELKKAVEIGTITSVTKKWREYSPTAEKPLVFHLHGSITYPSSMVLTEQDYDNFLLRMNHVYDEKDILPTIIRKTLPGSLLLFIGYYIDDVNLNSIFQGALSFMSTIIRRGRNKISPISVPLIYTTTIKQEKALKYLQNNAAHKYGIEIHLTYTNQFINELQTRWNKFKNKNI